MSVENKMFGKAGDAQKILETARTQVAGQKMSDEKIQRVQEKIAAAATDHTLEAAEFTERILEWLNEEWNEREFTPEQRIFSVALATINLRQHFPEDRGGKEFFDKVSKAAWEYWAANQ